MSIRVLALIFTVCSAAKIRDLPSYFPKCNINDPNINACLLKATETVKPFLIKGVPELGAPPLSPFKIQKVNLEQRSPSISFDAVLTNVSLNGLETYKFSEFLFDIPTLTWSVKIELKNIALTGNYKVNGTLLGTPIHGNGLLTSSIGHINIDGIHQVKYIVKNGLNYTTPVNTQINMIVNRPFVHLDGLFDGDADLNRLTNNVIKDNIDTLFEDMKPLIQRVMGNIFEQYMINLIEDRIPFHNLYTKE